jgi:dTDP-4-dehydrorhamnose reductase
MGGFFGGHIRDKNFVGKLLRHIYSHMTPFQSELLIGDRIWQPSYTLDLALNTLHLIDNNASGVWCMASQGYTDFYSLAKECISLLGVDKYFYVRRVSSSEVEDRELAKRPKKLVMSTRKLEAAGLSLLRNWEDSLRSYIVNEWLCDFEKHPLFSNMTEQKAA